MAGKRDVLLGRSGIGGGSSLSSRGSRIVMAIGVGVIVGCVFALLFPDGFFPPHRERILVGSSSSSQVQSSPCESSEKFNTLKSEFTAISEEKTELEKKVKVLTLALELAKQQQSPADQPKAGPFGTVKALRKTPTVIPDESVNPRLGKLLQEVAMNKELILVLANSRVTEMLKVWYRNVKRVGIRNYLVVALDDATESLCRSDDVPVYRRDPNEGVDSIGRDGSNHEVSGLKFRILREFLQLGYGVLMSDVDIIYLQNPFDHLYRDSDVESMSDGYDNMTAYGYDDVFDDPKMGWARYAHTMRIWVFNSGFFYLRPTIPSIELLDRVADRLAKSKAWDQAVFNEELFLPSHPGYEGLHASKRVMDRFDFMNSKLLFTQLRHDGRINQIKPVIIHVNYHPNKMDRMNAIEQFYVHGKMDALKSFPDGSE